VTHSLRIAELAEHADVSTATIRYYERIGLLPQPSRAPNGYRIYDDTTVARLGFISRAKQLGCTLDEITELNSAWEGGSCGPVQDGLRVLVADKRVAIELEVERLGMLATELAQAAEVLAGHRPSGSCDDDCGCVTAVAPTAPASPGGTAISLSAKPPAGEPVACTLEPTLQPGRLQQWRQLVARAVHRVEIPAGMRLDFRKNDLAAITELVAAEQDCCAFFSFRITVDARGVSLETTAPAEAAEAIRVLLAT